MWCILGQFLGFSTQNGRGEWGTDPISSHFMDKFLKNSSLRCTLNSILCVLNLRGETSNLILPYFLVKFIHLVLILGLITCHL